MTRIRDYNESGGAEQPDERPPLDPELKELVEEKRAEHKADPERVIELDGRRLS